jgi:hypothetical protein
VLIRSHRFEFDAPDAWEAEQDGGRLTFRGPRNEELILSGMVAMGEGTRDAVDAATAQLLDNAKKAMRDAASHPDLDPVWDVKRDDAIEQIECWSAHAQTKDRTVMFSQAVVVRPGAVMLVTFEAPNDVERLDTFTRVLKSFRPVTGN